MIQALPVTEFLSDSPPEPEWIIANFLAKGTITCLAGDSNVGKSFWSYSLALRLALGVPILGTVNPRTTTLYIDQENSRMDLRGYLYQLYQGLGIPSSQDALAKEALSTHCYIGHLLLGFKGWDRVVSGLCEQLRPALVIIDTATSAFGLEGEEENQNAAASQVIRRLRGLNTTVLVLRHARLFMDKYGRERPIRSMRGAKIWRALVDQVAYLVPRGGRPGEELRKGWKALRLEPDKTRAYGLPHAFDLIPQYAGDHGRQIVEAPAQDS